MSYLVSKEKEDKEKEKKREETVIGTVERFPLPARPAMNPSAMAAAVARHQVTKQIKSGVGNSKQINRGKCFFLAQMSSPMVPPFLCLVISVQPR